MNIHITVVQRKDMRPEVDGADWFFDSQGDLQVRICPMSNWRHEFLLGIHEAVEAAMCRYNGVSQKEVDEFDRKYDETHENDIEAGDDPAAPYAREHCFATAIERILCAELGVHWSHYDRELVALYPGPRHKAS